MGLTIKDVLIKHWKSFAKRHRSQLVGVHYRAVKSVLECRTPALGGRLFGCSSCHTKHFAYHSCNHRSCPQCGAKDQLIWSAKQEARLLPVPYFMVTFTIPSELRSLCKGFPHELYNAMLKVSAQALKDVIETKNQPSSSSSKQAVISGFTSVLHTWGRQLQHHPHVHSIVPALALLGDKTITPDKGKFLVHYRPLAERFRNLLRLHLAEHHPDIFARLTPDQRRCFTHKVQWNVQLQHVGKGNTALRYLARYVCRSGYTDKRLIGYDKSGKNVLLRWTPSGTKESKITRLSIDAFLHRWLTHVLPRGFARVRHYGYLSSAAKKRRLTIWLSFGKLSEPTVSLPEDEPFCCPHCAAELRYLAALPRMQTNRGPPL